MKETYHVLGLMSGTSLDGLDMAYCSFWKEDGRWCFSLNKSTCIEYSPDFQEKLKCSIELSALDLLLLNNEFGKWMGEQAKTFINKNQLEVDFVSSHGHTVFHQIDKELTYQIGAGQTLANAAGQKVICDFRTLDVTLGGQGAPLVPIGDELLFSDYDFCLNLGGISNASFRINGMRKAFDISPANMLLSYILKSTGKCFDDEGKMASSGKLVEPLWNALNALGFYQQPFPKSLGYEWFRDEMMPMIDDSQANVEDQLHTAVHHIAFQISESLKPYAAMNNKMLVTGGGAKNLFLIEMIQYYLGNSIEVVIPETSVIDFKEAIVFAFMGVLRSEGEINCLSSVTGASKDSSSGVIFYPW
ncbi:anhydro-N-acetylmuramic acid kinase [Roseivirga seohaensis subsp. aquiponti]|uniref:Anhydro-N-acetylmuramic acid kinase n=1 Tax=Roseivirga seohaensis subsp. aquiponti TaxID=1566026 RepID=A0A0L8ALG4_9BACT|nr:anhydro-N-acetylmuramic acid kinase [Roseivirga seohaensis]KOF03081.1 anhydro-N-acetylmuramic acid kinase [Roseivirga seohaensis subsp. aquiponti]